MLIESLSNIFQSALIYVLIMGINPANAQIDSTYDEIASFTHSSSTNNKNV
jgi:hypothetical protein